MRTLTFTLAAVAGLAAGAGAPAHTLPAEALIEELILAANAGISLDQAVAMVERRFKARVVRADVRDEGGRRVYVLRLLSDDRVWTVRVDAESGSLL
jgi:uncharacterized membrane protein YkoI